MRRLFSSLAPSFAEDYTMFLCGCPEPSEIHFATEADDGTWTISGVYQNQYERELQRGLKTNRMIDVMIGIELTRYPSSLSVQDIIECDALKNEDYIGNFYLNELKSGRYQPTLMTSRPFPWVEEDDANELESCPSFQDDILSDIYGEQKTRAEIICGLSCLQSLFAVQNAEGKWDLSTLQEGDLIPAEFDLSMREAAKLMREVEVLKGVHKEPLQKNVIHHFSQALTLHTLQEAVQHSKHLTGHAEKNVETAKPMQPNHLDLIPFSQSAFHKIYLN